MFYDSVLYDNHSKKYYKDLANIEIKVILGAYL